MKAFVESLSMDELQIPVMKLPKLGRFWDRDARTIICLVKAVLAEFIGTALFIHIGVGASIATGSTPDGAPMTSARMVTLGLAYGLALVALIATFSHISGGHFNPAVSAAMFVTGNLSFLRAAAYWVAQLAGAILGAAFLRAAIPGSMYGHGLARGGVTTLAPGVTQAQGWLMETVTTYALVFVIFGTAVDKKRASPLAPIPVGFIVAANMITAVRFTGASMNPARSFGPSAVFGVFGPHGQHWIYWIGPLGGAVLAGLTYEFLFMGRRSGGDKVDDESKKDHIPSAQTATQATEQGVSVGVNGEVGRTNSSRPSAHVPHQDNFGSQITQPRGHMPAVPSLLINPPLDLVLH